MAAPIDMTQVFKAMAAGKDLGAEDLARIFDAMIAGHLESEQISAFLLGLEISGLSSLHISAAAAVMRAHMVPVSIDGDIIDIVGTGGTGLHTLSISTASAIVAASAGAKVAKHGNRAASSLSGTADTLSALGVNLDIAPQMAARCVSECGLGFLFAPNHHPAMRHVGPARRALGIRTIFNLLGPLCNPAGARRMLLGICDDRWRQPMASSLAALGCDHVWIVRGEDGMDEITITGTTRVTEIKGETVRTFDIAPDDFGLRRSRLADVRGGAPEVNAKALTELLSGKAGAYRDIVLLNAGTALMIAGITADIDAGIEKARAAIDQGDAAAVLARLAAMTHETAA